MRKVINIIKSALPYLKWMRNKYKLTAFILLVWVTFFDTYDMLALLSNKKKLAAIKSDIEFYKNEIEVTNEALSDLTTNAKTLEKFARETYLMKKPDEEIFVIVSED
jgi:cell division protein DivIC